MPSDLDLESRLRRGLGAAADEAPPAPRDLADLVRHRARRQRRTHRAVAAAGVAAALLFVGVPVAASTLVADGGTAAPAERSRPTPSVYDLPTRGTLAGDQEWLDAVAALPWLPAEGPPDPALPDPPVADRRVVYAGDVPSGRVALVLGREDGVLYHQWFTGPPEAKPAEMTSATTVSSTADQGRLALLDASGPDADEATLVLVARSGDSATWPTAPVVGADGSIVTGTEVLPLQDGVAVAELPAPVPWGTSIGISRDGRPLTTVFPDQSRRLAVDALPDVQPADPRGLAGRVATDSLGLSTAHLLNGYALTAAEADPTLLAAGRIAEGPTDGEAVLVGITFPSGATAAVLTSSRSLAEPEGSTTTTTMVGPWPAGTALLDRLVAVATGEAIAISGPRTGVLAEVLLADGTVSTTVPLVDGAGTGPYVPPAPDSVRVLDATGAVVAEGPFEGAG